MTADRVDRESPDPVYRQVAAFIVGRIQAGEWPLGARLPSEPVLAEAYQVNRDTVRRALKFLALTGRVRVVRGKGTYVTDPAAKVG
jgi:DNA-binding GntR family transcriptional regulator